MHPLEDYQNPFVSRTAKGNEYEYTVSNIEFYTCNKSSLEFKIFIVVILLFLLLLFLVYKYSLVSFNVINSDRVLRRPRLTLINEFLRHYVCLVYKPSLLQLSG